MNDYSELFQPKHQQDIYSISALVGRNEQSFHSTFNDQQICFEQKIPNDRLRHQA